MSDMTIPQAQSTAAPHHLRPRLALPSEGFVRLETVLSVFPVSRSAWWAGVRDGRFPKPIKLGPRTTAWHVADVRHLIEERRRAGGDARRE